VRINGALALAVPKERKHYGDASQYAVIWESLVAAMELSETINEFTEYKYRDNLLDQVILIFSVLQLADFFTAPLLFGRSQI
jgi:hypothetical protein